ncbi:hypothetical protein [Streptomyces sp. NPDC058657]|uniref:hypothetical protein n=1 Tax=unclassified Streptomyces TaxID=2593676 RepID=UPI0036460C32
MPRTSHSLVCVVPDAPRSQLAAPDAVVIIVIAVLACAMSRSGMDNTSTLTVLAGAGLVATSALLLLRGARPATGHRFLRVLHAISAP